MCEGQVAVCPSPPYRFEVVLLLPSKREHSNFTPEVHFTCHEEYYSACENHSVMSSVGLDGAF